MGKYAGDSIRKSLIRVQAYSDARDIMEAHGRLGSASVVALAGDAGVDADVVRAFGLCSRPEDLMLVDAVATGLRAGEARWPGIATYEGWFHEAPLPSVVDLAILDFCGSFESPLAVSAMRALRGRLRNGSTIIVTFAYGREQNGSFALHSARHDPRAEGHVLGREAACGVTLAAAVGLSPSWAEATRRGVRESASVLHVCAHHRYTGHRQPMLCMVFYVTKLAYVKRALRRGEGFGDGFRLQGSRASDESLRSVVLATADALEDEGIDPSAALNVPSGSLAAWRAHRTRGTYARSA